MKFRTLSFKDFMLFEKHQELPLSDLGLVLVGGDNRLSACANSNAVGKTSIFDALSWALFGQTLRGLKGDEVAYRFNKDTCWVGLHLEINGKMYDIERTRRPAGLDLFTYNGTGEKIKVPNEQMKDVQGMIDGLLGFGSHTFRNAVMFGQGTFERFATAGQTDNMKMLDEIHSLHLGSALVRAREWRDKARGKLSELETKTENAVARNKSAIEQIELLESTKDGFAKQKQGDINEIQKRLESTRVTLAELEAEHVTTSGKVHLVKEMREEANKLEGDGKKGDGLKVRVQETTFQLSTLEKARAEVLAKLTQLLESGKCPICRIALTGEKKREVERGYSPDFQKADASISASKRNLETLKAEYEHIKQHLIHGGDLFSSKYQAPISGMQRLESIYSDAALEKQRLLIDGSQRKIQELEHQLTTEKEREWGGAAPLAAATKERDETTTQLTQYTMEWEQVKEAFAIAEYWIEAFGDRGIRSLAFDSVADFLNERLVEHLEILTAGEASVQISALSALKKGGVKERISVNAAWGWGAGSYTAGSASQDRRVDLAVFGAMQDLAERRSARPFPLRIWDEAGDSLDDKGKELFAEWVRKEARRRGSGFVITQDREFGEIIEPDSIWTVVLNKDGGSEVVIQ